RAGATQRGPKMWTPTPGGKSGTRSSSSGKAADPTTSEGKLEHFHRPLPESALPFRGIPLLRGMKWRSAAALGSATSADVGTFISGTTNGTVDGRFGRRTMSAAWIRKGDGRFSSVG